MNRNYNDEMNYCGLECWWSKTTIRPGSELDLELKEIEKTTDNPGQTCAISLFGSGKHPGLFFSCPVAEDVHAWAYFVKETQVPAANQSNDLTRRGGTILNGDAKLRELVEPNADRCKLLQLFIRDTPASDITRAGIYDRKNLDLSFVDGRVALLGDAAHPQSPIMGQGANMAIVDGYVVAMRLAAVKMQNVIAALDEYDSDSRRKDVNKVIAEARKYGNYVTSQNGLACWLLRTVLKYSPPSFFANEMFKGDEPNRKLMDVLETYIKSKTLVA